jgi:hypothetical protein
MRNPKSAIQSHLAQSGLSPEFPTVSSRTPGGVELLVTALPSMAGFRHAFSAPRKTEPRKKTVDVQTLLATIDAHRSGAHPGIIPDDPGGLPLDVTGRRAWRQLLAHLPTLSVKSWGAVCQWMAEKGPVRLPEALFENPGMVLPTPCPGVIATRAHRFEAALALSEKLGMTHPAAVLNTLLHLDGEMPGYPAPDTPGAEALQALTRLACGDGSLLRLKGTRFASRVELALDMTVEWSNHLVLAALWAPLSHQVDEPARTRLMTRAITMLHAMEYDPVMMRSSDEAKAQALACVVFLMDAGVPLPDDEATGEKIAGSHWLMPELAAREKVSLGDGVPDARARRGRPPSPGRRRL